MLFGHGCAGDLMLLEYKRYSGLGTDALATVCCWEHELYDGLGMDALGSGCSWEHKRYYGLGMDALVTVCSCNTNVIRAWAWMHL